MHSPNWLLTYCALIIPILVKAVPNEYGFFKKA
jgi:hypothetical protein